MVKVIDILYNQITRGIIRAVILYQNYIFLTSWGVPTTDFIVIEPRIIDRWYNITAKRIDFYHSSIKIILEFLCR
jgi:hypothetical protein